MDDTLRSCREFVDILASDAPAPGGGGAAALTAAIGAALAHMVGALTVGKKKYAHVEDEIRALMARCEALQGELLDQVQADAQGFLPLARAYSIPRDDPNREAVMCSATLVACSAPIRIMQLCCDCLEVVSVMAEKGSRLAVSDAGCAAALLRGALQAASLNVFINTKTLSDRQLAQELNDQCLAMLERCALADEIFTQVKDSFFV